MQRIKLIIHGKVQGVFFRASAVEFAKNLNVAGYAKNLADGSVEVVAQGPEEDISKLIKYCGEGPKNAVVDRVDVSHEEVKNDFSDFSVKY